MGRRRTAVAACLAAIVLAATQAASASAQFETFMGQQGLSAGNAYASASAHTYVYRIETDSDHTACPAYSQGYAGYTSAPWGSGNNTWWSSANCGYGVAAWWPTTPYYQSTHGTAYNPNGATFDNFTWAIYWW